jgi:hypothetical protein
VRACCRWPQCTERSTQEQAGHLPHAPSAISASEAARRRNAAHGFGARAREAAAQTAARAEAPKRRGAGAKYGVEPGMEAADALGGKIPAQSFKGGGARGSVPMTLLVRAALDAGSLGEAAGRIMAAPRQVPSRLPAGRLARLPALPVCLSACLPACLPAFLPALPACLPICPPAVPTDRPTDRPTDLTAFPTHLPAYLPAYPPTHLCSRAGASCSATTTGPITCWSSTAPTWTRWWSATA